MDCLKTKAPTTAEREGGAFWFVKRSSESAGGKQKGCPDWPCLNLSVSVQLRSHQLNRSTSVRRAVACGPTKPGDALISFASWCSTSASHLAGAHLLETSAHALRPTMPGLEPLHRVAEAKAQVPRLHKPHCTSILSLAAWQACQLIQVIDCVLMPLGFPLLRSLTFSSCGVGAGAEDSEDARCAPIAKWPH